MKDEEIRDLIAKASRAAGQSYAPYSRFPVGAALRSGSGEITTGCNVENASYGLTICAERNAVAAAVARGLRDFDAIAVVTKNGVTPCGACRQVLAEFNPHLTVIVADQAGNYRLFSLAELLPATFVPEQLFEAVGRPSQQDKPEGGVRGGDTVGR